MDLRSLIAQTRSLADMADGRPIAIFGRGLVVAGFGQSAEAWQEEYQRYLSWQMADLEEKMPAFQVPTRPNGTGRAATVPPGQTASRSVRTIDF